MVAITTFSHLILGMKRKTAKAVYAKKHERSSKHFWFLQRSMSVGNYIFNRRPFRHATRVVNGECKTYLKGKQTSYYDGLIFWGPGISIFPQTIMFWWVKQFVCPQLPPSALVLRNTHSQSGHSHHWVSSRPPIRKTSHDLQPSLRHPWLNKTYPFLRNTTPEVELVKSFGRSDISCFLGTSLMQHCKKPYPNPSGVGWMRTAWHACEVGELCHLVAWLTAHRQRAREWDNRSRNFQIRDFS